MSVDVAPVVSLEAIERTFPGPPIVRALKSCDLTIHPGDFVTIVGPSGSGKSTLLNVVGLLDRPTAGRYELDGEDVSSMNERTRTAVRGQQIGFVFQSFELLNRRSSLENVMLTGLYSGVGAKQREQNARLALHSVGLESKVNSTPSLMSGGERQRVAIARALAGSPSLLLCDEPTGNLDSQTSAAILDLLDQLHESGVTIMLITHDRDIARQGARTVSIADGVLREVDATELLQ